MRPTPPPETWGQLMRRLRGKRPTRVVAAEIRKAGWPLCHTTVVRLEKLEKPPKQMRQQITAARLAVLYGYSPTAVGLPEMPSVLVRPQVQRSRGRLSSVASQRI